MDRKATCATDGCLALDYEAEVAALKDTLIELQGLVPYNSPEHHVINESLAALLEGKG